MVQVAWCYTVAYSKSVESFKIADKVCFSLVPAELFGPGTIAELVSRNSFLDLYRSQAFASDVFCALRAVYALSASPAFEPPATDFTGQRNRSPSHSDSHNADAIYYTQII
jgi:hypothetical protein